MSFDFIQCSKFIKMRIETSDHWQFESSFTISASMIEKVQSESTPPPHGKVGLRNYYIRGCLKSYKCFWGQTKINNCIIICCRDGRSLFLLFTGLQLLRLRQWWQQALLGLTSNNLSQETKCKQTTKFRFRKTRQHTDNSTL